MIEHVAFIGVPRFYLPLLEPYSLLCLKMSA